MGKTIKTWGENEKVYNTGFCVKSDNCNDEGMQDGWDNTVENVFKEMEDYSKCKDCEKRQKDFIELTPNEEESRFKRWTMSEFRVSRKRTYCLMSALKDLTKNVAVGTQFAFL